MISNACIQYRCNTKLDKDSSLNSDACAKVGKER